MSSEGATSFSNYFPQERHGTPNELWSELLKEGLYRGGTTIRVSKEDTRSLDYVLPMGGYGWVQANLGASIITNIMFPYSLYNYGLWYLKWTSQLYW